ncbi:MAG: MerR family DNA-binding protein [Betaproteobacteria bacterium]
MPRGPSHVQRLLFIRRARAPGFGPDAIGSLLSLGAPGRRCCASVRKLAAGHLDDVCSRLAER